MNLEPPPLPPCPACGVNDYVVRSKAPMARWECEAPGCWTLFQGTLAEFEKYAETRKMRRETQG